MTEHISNETISRAADGDQTAFELIYRSFSKFVYNVSWRIVNSLEDAEEVTQEVFLTVYRKLKDFRCQSELKTWVYRITINKAINYSKRSPRGRNIAGPFEEEWYAGTDKGQVMKNIDKEYNTRLIGKLLASLSPDQRACVVLRNVEGLSYKEIAGTLNININTVRSRLSRAREYLLSIKNEVIQNELR